MSCAIEIELNRDKIKVFRLLSASLLVVVCVISSYGIALKCTFKDHSSYWGQKYACVVSELTTSLTNRIVTEIQGTHMEGRTHDDVVKVFAEHQHCPYLPTNLGTFFKNLEVLYVMKSNVSQLTTDDLTGLTKLKLFDVSYNPITLLRHDFFKGHESIEIISFYDCQLRMVEKGSLAPLVNLKEGHFEFNPCINFRGDDESRLPALIKEIHQNCQEGHGVRTTKTSFDSAESNYDPDYDGGYGDVHWDSADEDIEDDEQFLTTTKSAISSISYQDTVNEQIVVSDESFVRRHAVLIILFLVAIVCGLLAFLYKINAFNRNNWR